MKYQKSMLKLLEKIIANKDEKSIEFLIRETKTGRNSSFEALNFLEDKGFVEIKDFGNQKIVHLIKSNSVLQFKHYLDLMEFKSLDSFVKLIISVFVFYLFGKKKIKSALLFGSALRKKNFNDIDILLLGDNLSVADIKSLDNVKNIIERIFGVIINLHKGEFNFDNQMNGITVYQCSYISEYTNVQKHYFEFLNSVFDTIIEKEKEFFNLSVINLAYVYCFAEGISPRTKSEALEFFDKRYKVKNLKELKKWGIEIGKKIFR